MNFPKVSELVGVRTGRAGGHVTGRGPGPEQVCFGPTYSVWVLDSLQERFHSRSSGDFERFIKAGAVK